MMSALPDFFEKYFYEFLIDQAETSNFKHNL